MTSLGFPATRLVETFHFCSAGNGVQLLASGFSNPEPDHTWVINDTSSLTFPATDAPTNILVLHLCPFLHENLATGFHLRVLVNGAEAFSGKIEGDTVIGLLLEARNSGRIPSTITLHCTGAIAPAQAGLIAESRPLKFRLMRGWLFDCADDWQGHSLKLHDKVLPDSKILPDRIAQMTGMVPSKLVTSFESLGHSCDFGLMQREVGAEPLGLLRFAGSRTAHIFRGLMTSFAKIGLPGSVSTYVVDGFDEYWIYDALFGLYYHTFISPNAAAPEQVVARETYRLPMLARKLMEDVDNGEKIFILRRPEPLSRSEALAIWAALNARARNTLLYLNNSSGGAPGTVNELGPRLLCGHLDGMLGDVAPSVGTWLSICANAHLATRDGHVNSLRNVAN